MPSSTVLRRSTYLAVLHQAMRGLQVMGCPTKRKVIPMTLEHYWLIMGLTWVENMGLTWFIEHQSGGNCIIDHGFKSVSHGWLSTKRYQTIPKENPPNWMGGLPETVKTTQEVLPKAHRSGTSWKRQTELPGLAVPCFHVLLQPCHLLGSFFRKPLDILGKNCGFLL